MPAQILIVEKNAVIAADEAALLKKWGHSVVGFASNETEATAFFSSQKIDLVVAHARLEGERDWLFFLEKWGLPTVVVTGFLMRDLTEKAGFSSQTSYLSKPFLPFQLKKLIFQTLSQKPN